MPSSAAPFPHLDALEAILARAAGEPDAAPAERLGRALFPLPFVTAGTQLAVAYNLDKIFVTARVDETDVKAVRPGQVVDVDVDAYPNAHITGRVREIQGGAAAVFSLFPQSNTGGNFQKVTQVIPVKIALDAPPTVDLVPGMNVTVHIHKH